MLTRYQLRSCGAAILAGTMVAACAEIDTTGFAPKSYVALKYDTTVRQRLDFTCSAAALATILTHYWGRPTVEEDVLKIFRARYPDPEAWQAARPNQPLPDGTTLILEMRAAKLGADGQPTLDKDGRFIADDKVSALAVQQKKRGFGAEYPEAFRNPDWEYAVFEPDFKLRASAATQPCMQCHKPRAKDDYTMVAARIVNEQKKK